MNDKLKRIDPEGASGEYARGPTEKDQLSNGLAIPEGLVIGIGIGILAGNVAAGVLVGLGVGFLLMMVMRAVVGEW